MVTAGNCTTFQQGIQAGVALPICLNVQNTGELVGSSEVCFPNPTGSAGFKVYRCSRRAVCLPLEVKSNDLCCGELTKRTTLTFNPYCVETDGFSDFLATPIPTQTLRDADSDLRPDLVDNCPTTFNPFQADTDNDGIGDVCEATPKPVPVKGIAPALALLLVGVGAFILRRKVLS
ncbi:MAG: thrombospondin type 3 repeat-containing protein [Myxococcales bacterium]|nr:thrombospondin type 3 repeat-containing protein [Myxococcales bacterium]